LSLGRQAGRQAGSKEAWGLLWKVCMCVCRLVGIYLSAEVNHEEGRKEEDNGGLFRKSFVLLLRGG